MSAAHPPVSTTVTNNGQIIGDVLLGSGEDLYQGTGSVSGWVYGQGSAESLPAAEFHRPAERWRDNDTLSGAAGNDVLFGDTGDDTMSGGAGNDAFFVESAGDVVSEIGGSGIDTVSSLITFNFSDAVHAKGALEKLVLTGNAAINGTGNALANTHTGNIAANILCGLAGNDVLNGGSGNDRLLGGLGNDVLRGQDGLDRLHGGAGKDTLIGGANADTFVFDTAPNTATNRDIVTDFVHGQDKFWLENAVFAKVGAAGALKAGAFHAGTGRARCQRPHRLQQGDRRLVLRCRRQRRRPAVQFACSPTSPCSPRPTSR